MASDDIPNTQAGQKKSPPLTTNDVDDLKVYFGTIKPKEPHSSRHAIFALRTDIDRLKQMGYTDLDICTMIEKRGYRMPISTFRSYLRQAKAHEHGTRGNKTASRKRRLPRHKSSNEATDAPSKSTTGRFKVTPDEQV